MKIQGVSGIKPTKRVESTATSEGKDPAPGDRVSTEQQSKLKAVRQAAQRTGEQQHTSRLAEIEAQIRMGTYKPDARRIAEEILNAAQLQAQVAAMIN